MKIKVPIGMHSKMPNPNPSLKLKVPWCAPFNKRKTEKEEEEKDTERKVREEDNAWNELCITPKRNIAPLGWPLYLAL